MYYNVININPPTVTCSTIIIIIMIIITIIDLSVYLFGIMIGHFYDFELYTTMVCSIIVIPYNIIICLHNPYHDYYQPHLWEIPPTLAVLLLRIISDA